MISPLAVGVEPLPPPAPIFFPKSLTQSNYKSKRKASAAGIVAVVSRFTAAGAPMLSGYIMQFISIDLPFFLAAGFQLASASLMYLIFKDVKPPDEL